MAYQSIQKIKDKVLLFGVFFESPSIDHKHEMNELFSLVSTLGVEVVDEIVQYGKRIDSKYFVGKGKLQEILSKSELLECDYIIFNNDILPSHMKNIQNFCKDKVQIKDRTGIILDIFMNHAKTNESKTQIKLAQLEYYLPRLTRQWTHLERQMGGVGTRGGPGEKQIEIDRRLIRNQINKLKKNIDSISQSRSTQNKKRENIYKVSLVGYTNAGKSTLMQSLTNQEVYIKDELFATLGTMTRKVHIDKHNKLLISDTVGFIRNIPTNLLNSFRSTLSELQISDLLVKVIDVNSEEFEKHINTINKVLEYLKLEEKDFLIVFNKIDLFNNIEAINKIKKTYPNSIFLSARKKIRINYLIERIKDKMNKDDIIKDFILPYQKIHLIDFIYSNSTVLFREDKNSRIRFRIKGKVGIIKKIENKINTK